MNAPSVLTISQLNMYVKSLLDGDPFPQQGVCQRRGF